MSYLTKNCSPKPKIERVVEVGVQTRLRMRLLAYRVSQEVAEQRRRRLREYARKKQRTPTKESLFLAGWVLMLTNVPAEMLTIEEALVVGRVRWQVEILFRMWKSHMYVDEWRSENPWRILSETYAKFIALTILHWVLLLEWGHHFDLSLIKAAQAVQKVALSLGLALFERGDFEQPLRRLLRVLQVACRQNKRRTKPATFQLLLALENTLS
ncbi:MAG: transposase [Anaerolineae bacterium]|nr:transposase [Anaerolineae bacterium]